ncbi:hypothetical protein JXB37_08105 [candidate division WOR-3 bacterium]|nr:hypothetical protein [candidate division WOR-3 bacterium]
MQHTRLIAALALAGLLVPAAAPAANICAWNYDPLDTWYDSEIGQTINSAWWVEQVLEAQGHTVDVYNTTFPTDISGYDAVFCLMGWYRC